MSTTQQQLQYVQNQPGAPVNIGAQPQMVFVQIPKNTTSSQLSGFASKTSLALGITQLSLGVLSVILGITAIILLTGLGVIGSGIWCGILFCITGCLGIGASKNKGKCLICATLVCSILSASLSGGYLIVITAIGMIFEDEFGWSDYSLGSRHFVNGLIVTVAIAECIIAIIHSSICCRAVCCGRQQYNAPVYYAAQPGVPPQQQQMIMTTTGGQVMIPPAGQMMMQPAGQMMMPPPGQAMVTTVPQGGQVNSGQALGYQPGYQPYSQQPPAYQAQVNQQGQDYKQGQPI
ncbi:uncharacterized protein LOC144441054 [Glandiceps talaboti]